MIAYAYVKKRSKTFWCVFDFPKKEEQLKALQKKSESPDFWDDSERATQVMKQLSRLREEIENCYRKIKKLEDERLTFVLKPE